MTSSTILPATCGGSLQARTSRRFQSTARVAQRIAAASAICVAAACGEPPVSGGDKPAPSTDDDEETDDSAEADTAGSAKPSAKDAGRVPDARVDAGTSNAGSDAGHYTDAGSASGVDGAAPRDDAGPRSDAGTLTEAPDAGVNGEPADECAGGTSLPDSAAPASKTKASSQSDGTVQFMLTASKNSLKRLRTKLIVPPLPKGSSTLFIWPGVQPGYGNNGSIGNGVLQPVLTWGASCLRFDNKPTWWISGEYVNVSSFDPKYANCHGGEGMEVAVGDELEMIIEANGTVWRQTVTDMQKSKTVTYDIDLGGQLQAWFIWSIEMQSSTKPTVDIVFTDTTIAFEKPDENACQPISRGTTDYISGPRVSPSKTTCCLDKITLRAPGVTATTKP